MTCLVCGSRQSEPHFGGNSCRACAAFFRRYFNSNKSVIICICKTKKANSHPCRSCRMAKCFAVGMTPLKIHGQRDPNGSSPRKLEKSALFQNRRPIKKSEAHGRIGGPWQNRRPVKKSEAHGRIGGP
ncbi:hypothetical protein CRE_08641 [Caenorhabditis remanei]|uniref:Nuclear receptor domain-containing protein n=1 Tax=Caenorhabditis remanei TaxID=31234 RepID=E3LIZ6_CAERE|nr:hypothetical protein CRE_08641 [Caenorhabditis remanei]